MIRYLSTTTADAKHAQNLNSVTEKILTIAMLAVNLALRPVRQVVRLAMHLQDDTI